MVCPCKGRFYLKTIQLKVSKMPKVMESLRSVVGSEPDIFHRYQVPPAFDNSLHKILTSHLISGLSLLSD